MIRFGLGFLLGAYIGGALGTYWADERCDKQIVGMVGSWGSRASS